MNILVINGSPKGERSNTYRLTGAFLDGISAWNRESENPEPIIETLEVSKLQIRPCLGCFFCWSKTPGECCLHDDMRLVLEKLLWADLTVWSFPLYYFGIPGPLKNLIDRQLPMNLPFMSSDSQNGGHPSRYDLSGKRTAVLSTCGFYTAEGNYDAVTTQFDHFCGKGGYTAIFCGQGELFRVKELSERTNEYLSWVKQAGREFAAGSIQEGTYQKLREILFPRDVFEAMADASWGVSPMGEKEDDSLIFTRQMAALYQPKAYPGRDLVLEMHYTDLGKTYWISLEKAGSKVLDAYSGTATTRIHTPYTVWRSIAAGEIAGDEALMKHMYQVEGDFDLMLHWDDYFGAGRELPQEAQKAPKSNRTNMALLLAPWIVFWVAAAIDNFWGSLVSIGVCVCTPLLMLSIEPTVYDRLSSLAVGGCAMLLLAGVPADWIVPGSYLLFGAMWSISCLLPIPLTAHYSKNSYNGDAALRNPIFMRTNRILTAAWGVLYLLTPIWTYRIMQTDAGGYVGAINSVLPAIMGIFTDWFQKWYPKHVARG